MERRVFHRVSVEYPARVIVENEDGNVKFETKINVINISQNGIGFVTNELLPEMSAFILEIDISHKCHKIVTKARAVWNTQDLNIKQFRYGVVCLAAIRDEYTQIIGKLLDDFHRGCFLFELSSARYHLKMV